MAKSPPNAVSSLDLEAHHQQRIAEASAYRAIAELLNNPNTNNRTKLDALSIFSNLMAISKAHPPD